MCYCIHIIVYGLGWIMELANLGDEMIRFQIDRNWDSPYDCASRMWICWCGGLSDLNTTRWNIIELMVFVTEIPQDGKELNWCS